MVSKILGPLFNTLTAHHLYSCHNWQNLPQQVQTQLSSTPSTFSRSFIAFPKYTYNFQHFEKIITFIAFICPKLFILKSVVRLMPWNWCFRKPFGNEPVKESKIVLKSPQHHFYANVQLISKKLSFVWCLLVGSEILGPLITRWRPITCILVIIDRNSHNKFKYNYLQNCQHFLQLLFDFQNLHKILTIFKNTLPS